MGIEAEDISSGQLSGVEGKAETMKRLCRILSIVHAKRVGWSDGPCDCICPEREGSPRYWRSTGEALRWLEMLVEALPSGRVQVELEERFRIGDGSQVTYHDLEVREVARPSEGGGSDG